MNNNIKAIKQLNNMVILTIITQLVLLLKNALVASHFGISLELDAFNLTNNISSFVYSFIGAGVSTVIIPYLKDKKNKISIDIFISVIYPIGFIILLLMLTNRESIIFLISGAEDNLFLDTASRIFIFTAVTGFINSIIQLIRAVLEFHGRFNRQKLAILFTSILLVLMLWINNNVSIYYYASFVLITTIITIIIYFIFISQTKFKYNINYNITNSDFIEMIKLYIPTILSTSVYQVSLLIDTSIAARLDVGSISILSYANSVISMVNMLFLGNLTSFIYPRLVKKSNDHDQQRSLISYVILINAIMCLIIVLFYSVGKEGISILFERGEFTSANTNLVYLCAFLYAISLPTNGIRDLIYKYYYIKKDTYSPFINSIMISLINIVLSIVLSYYIGLYGVVIGSVVASYISLLFISLKFRRKFHIYYNEKNFIIENLKVIISSILTLIILIVLKNILVLENVLISVIVYSVLTICIFLFFIKIFKSHVFKVNL